MRLLEERHAPQVFALVDREREHLRPWMPWLDATQSGDDTLAYIKSVLEQFANNRGFVAGIWRGDQFAGTIGTHQIDWLNRRAEIGYWIGREFEGIGVVTEAVRLVTTHLFRDLDLHRVEIRCAASNTRSASIPKRLGFTFEATLREAHLVNGVHHDLLVFAMLKQDWKA